MFLKISILIWLFSGILFSASTPKMCLSDYYAAMQTGDIARLQQVMTHDSFKLTIEVWALSIALKEPAFKQILNDYMKMPQATAVVNRRVSDKLKHATKKSIRITGEEIIAKDRIIIRFTENGKPKKLYFSADNGEWKIDYHGGRKK